MQEKTVVSTERAPAAVGPYSQAIRVGGFVFASGQIPLDPATGQLVSGDIRKQVRQVMENVSAVLEAAGSSLSRVVKTTVFITDMERFGEVNEAYSEFFTGAFPARSCVQVARLPKGAEVEVEAIARCD